MPELSQKQLERGALALMFALLAFFFAWLFGVEPIFKAWVESRVGTPWHSWPSYAGLALSIGVGLVLPLGVCILVWYFAYKRWFIPSRTRVAADQMAKLADARRALAAAVSFIEYFENDLKSKSVQAERLHQEVLSLKSLNKEGVEELERKLKAMDILNRNRLWLERMFAFLIGIISSLAASYLWESFKR